MIRVCSLDISPPIAASSNGWGRSLSAKAKAPELAFGLRGVVMAPGCFEEAGLLSSKEYSLGAGLLFRLLPRRRKARRAAMSAPAMAQPTPIPAAAPFEIPLDEDG